MSEERDKPYNVEFAEFGIDCALKVYWLPVGRHRTRYHIEVTGG